MKSKGRMALVYFITVVFTSYFNEELKELSELNQAALSLVVDVNLLENQQNCRVGSLGAIMGEMDGQTYLCWTISPKYSYVISYTSGTVGERVVFQIAESVKEDMS